jgi:hypothetical protein
MELNVGIFRKQQDPQEVRGGEILRRKGNLRGESGLEFDEKFNPDMFKQMGYTLRRT